MSATISCPPCSWRQRRCSVPSPSPVRPTVLSMWPGSWARALLTSSHRPEKKVKSSIQTSPHRAEYFQQRVYTLQNMVMWDNTACTSAHRQHNVMLHTSFTAIVLLHIYINIMLTCLSRHVNNSSTSRDCTKRSLWICDTSGNSSYCEYCILPKAPTCEAFFSLVSQVCSVVQLSHKPFLSVAGTRRVLALVDWEIYSFWEWN